MGDLLDGQMQDGTCSHYIGTICSIYTVYLYIYIYYAKLFALFGICHFKVKAQVIRSM